MTLIIFFLQQTWGHVNLNFPGGGFKHTSAHIFLPLSLEKKKKKTGKICDILPRCNEAVFYEMSWEEVAAERGAANAGELPCVRGGGEKGNL